MAWWDILYPNIRETENRYQNVKTNAYNSTEHFVINFDFISDYHYTTINNYYIAHQSTLLFITLECLRNSVSRYAIVYKYTYASPTSTINKDTPFSEITNRYKMTIRI